MKRLKWQIYLLSFFMTINFTTPIFASFCQLQYGLSSAQITSLFAVYSLSVFLFEIPTGVLGDKIGENNSLIIGAAFTAVAMFLFINGTTALLYFGEFIFGLGSTFFSGSFDSIIFKYCKDKKNNLDFEEIVSKSYSLQWIALCVSFLGCFLILKSGELAYVFWATFIANIALLFIVSFLPRIKKDGIERNTDNIVKNYFFEIISNRQLLIICLLNMCFSMLLATGYQILQTYLLNSPIAEKNNGLLYFIAAIFASGGAYFYKKLKNLFQNEIILISICLMLLSFCMFGLGITSEVILIFIFVCAYRLVWGIASPMFSSLVNQNIDDDSFRNTAFSIISLGYNLGSSALLFLFSIINISARLEYIILGLLCIALFVSCMVFMQIYNKA